MFMRSVKSLSVYMQNDPMWVIECTYSASRLDNKAGDLRKVHDGGKQAIKGHLTGISSSDT